MLKFRAVQPRLVYPWVRNISTCRPVPRDSQVTILQSRYSDTDTHFGVQAARVFQQSVLPHWGSFDIISSSRLGFDVDKHPMVLNRDLLHLTINNQRTDISSPIQVKTRTQRDCHSSDEWNGELMKSSTHIRSTDCNNANFIASSHSQP